MNRVKPGLGGRFLDVVIEALERIARDPLAWTPADEDVRRCLMRVFPFGVFYTIEPRFHPDPGCRAFRAGARLLDIEGLMIKHTYKPEAN